MAAALAMAPGTTLAQDSEPTWVFFADKGVGAGELEQALTHRAQTLAPRALARRQRMRGDGGVDRRDLTVFPLYRDGVLASGATHRATSRWLNAISVIVDPQQLAVIEALPYVTGTLPVARRQRSALPPLLADQSFAPTPKSGDRLDYGLAAGQLELIEVDKLHACGLDGTGVVAGVLDTGFVLDHQAFAGLTVLDQHDFINNDGNPANETGDASNQHNHGTMILSLLAGRQLEQYWGVAPAVSVILAKTEDVTQEQPIEEDWWVEGIEWVEALGADLATSSLGYVDWYAPEDLDGQTAVTSKAATLALANGMVLISSAGNEGPGPTSIVAPADTDGLIAVGAVNGAGAIANFSSRGPTADGRFKPDLCAQGVANWVVTPGSTDAYEQVNGTSCAAPMVAGVVALLLQAFPNLTPKEMHELLTTTASNATTPDNDYGWGIVAGHAAAGLYCTCVDLDADTFYDVGCGGQDCDDGDLAVYPGAEELCNGIDDDCDGELLADEGDQDGDGALACDDDCDDDNEDVYPGTAEICDDLVDNDCDGDVDEEDSECDVEPPPPPPPPPTAEEANVPLEGGCGCLQAGGRTGPWSFTALLGLILLRRRNQGRRAG
jgi:serine protease AprX